MLVARARVVLVEAASVELVDVANVLEVEVEAAFVELVDVARVLEVEVEAAFVELVEVARVLDVLVARVELVDVARVELVEELTAAVLEELELTRRVELLVVVWVIRFSSAPSTCVILHVRTLRCTTRTCEEKVPFLRRGVVRRQVSWISTCGVHCQKTRTASVLTPGKKVESETTRRGVRTK